MGLFISIIDWSICDGLIEILIEEWGGEEVIYIYGYDDVLCYVCLIFEKSFGLNYGFDVMLVCYVIGFIIECGVCDVSEEGLFGLFLEEKK